MPHLIVESSTELSEENILTLHKAVGDQDTVSIDAVKTRYYMPLVSMTGKEGVDPHLSITIKLLAGRSEELKEQMALNLLEASRGMVSHNNISVEIVDLQVYKKI